MGPSTSLVAIVILAVVGFFIVFDAGQLQRLNPHYLKVSAALRAGYNFAYVTFPRFDFEIALAFRTDDFLLRNLVLSNPIEVIPDHSDCENEN